MMAIEVGPLAPARDRGDTRREAVDHTVVARAHQRITAQERVRIRVEPDPIFYVGESAAEVSDLDF
jgi:hypothetical protein